LTKSGRYKKHTMFGNIITFLLSLVLFPVCFGAGKSFFYVLVELFKVSASYSLWTYFICGFISYVVLQLIFFKPLKLYVFGHELTHALVGLISGARLKSFKVKQSSGSVTLSKVNLLTVLSPYFVPLYTLLLMLCYVLFGFFAKKAYGIHHYFVFLLGMSIAFHIALTIFAIFQGQSDFQRYGIIYSLIIVFLANCIFLAFLFSLFFPVSFWIFLKSTVKNSADAYVWIYDIIKELWILKPAAQTVTK